MRNVFLCSYVGRPEFSGATTKIVDVLDNHTRREVTAPCGCVWRGLVSIRGAGVSDGQITTCDTHAVADNDE